MQPDILPVKRLLEVDLLRGLTMLLMVFVNDLWTLTGVPAWMLHVPPGADGMGLSDTVFPAFLFIVGLSLPLSLQARREKGDRNIDLVLHIVSRALALIVMGLFLVNGENLNQAGTGMSKHLWYTCCCTSFFLVWNSYPKLQDKKWIKLFRSAGVVMLLYLAWTYQGGKDGATYNFKPHWWGILGLIGWSYLAGGIWMLATRMSISGSFLGWLFFSGASMAHHAQVIPERLRWIPEPIIGGTMTALVMGGVMTMMAFQYFQKETAKWKMTLLFLLAAIILWCLYAWSRPIWGLSKLQATPAWLFICSAITLLAFLMVYYITNVIGKPELLSFSLPAGKHTLLTYFMPFFMYALFHLMPDLLPDWMKHGNPGLLKSVAFALICSWLAAFLARLGIVLKL